MKSCSASEPHLMTLKRQSENVICHLVKRNNDLEN